MIKSFGLKDWLKVIIMPSDRFLITTFPLFSSSQNLMFKNEEIARDIVQDLFLKLTDHKEIFSSVTNLKSYLYTTVKNSCIKQLKHVEVRNRYSLNILSTHDEEEKFWIKVLEEETFRILYQSIEKLPPQTKAVYHLSMKGLKNQEIADKLGVSLETVKTHKQIGKKYLQKYMKDLFYILSIFKI